ncbi:TolC family protein [Algoriphagus sp. D3-2-R+10]|uniref:TolC family protein n=1 Tax=Algoriphagus aurantiacus TaxID=3103948 RepID=UPI002B3EBEBE|nr:TolC family protein [Algoriphagus sp. D3-2-R+10]MEB2775827.1 TolC family protein [Algoriphagus sp. D3-2-R+10]
MNRKFIKNRTNYIFYNQLFINDMLKKYLTYAFFLWAPTVAIGQEAMQEFNLPDTLTLKESIQIGLENNRTLKKAILDEEKAKYQRNEIRGAGLPQFSAYGQYNNFLDVFPQAVPGGIFGGDPSEIQVISLGVPQSLKAGFELNQLIFSNSYLIGLKAAKTGEEFYRILAEQSEEDVIHEISMNFLGVIQLELQKENLQANIDQLESLQKILQSQYDNDLARKVDLNRVKVNLTSIKSELENLEISSYQQEGYLKLLMGIPVDTEINLDQSIADTDQLIQDFQIQDLSIADRKDIQVLGVQKQLYEYEYKNIKAAHQPQLVGFADFNKNAFSEDFDFMSQNKVWYQGFLIGLKLQIPIFDGMQTKYKAAQSRVTAQQLDLDRLQAEDAAELEYKNALNKYYNSISTLKSLDGNLDLANDVLKETTLLYKEGLSPLTDLLDAETTQRAAQANFNNQIIQVRIAQLEILNSTGKITNLLL